MPLSLLVRDFRVYRGLGLYSGPGVWFYSGFSGLRSLGFGGIFRLKGLREAADHIASNYVELRGSIKET